MTANAARIELLQAHDAMASVLDSKLANMPEWKAFRAIDRALIALEVAADAPKTDPTPAVQKTNQERPDTPLGYVALTRMLFRTTGKPATTSEVIDFICNHRSFPDMAKAKVNITSSLSKEADFRNIVWNLKKVWWWADRDPPMPVEALTIAPPPN